MRRLAWVARGSHVTRGRVRTMEIRKTHVRTMVVLLFGCVMVCD